MIAVARLNPGQARSVHQNGENPCLALGWATINLFAIRFCGTGELAAGAGIQTACRAAAGDL